MRRTNATERLKEDIREALAKHERNSRMAP